MHASKNRVLIQILLVVVLLLSVQACGGGAEPTSEPAAVTSEPEAQQAAVEEPAATEPPTQPPPPTATLEPTPLPEPTATTAPTAPAELYLGDTVESSGYALAALGIADPAEPGFLYTAEAGKRLVAVEVLLSNNSGELLRVNPLYAELLDADGFVYQAELGGSAEQIGVVELLPGEKVRGWIAFKAPDAAVLKSLRYALDPFGAQTLQVELTAAPEGHVAVAGTTSALTSLPASKVGETVEDFGMSLSATMLEDPTAPGILYTPKAGSRLMAVEVVLGNVNAEKHSANPLNFYLVDSQGYVYVPELGGRDDQMAVVDLNPGEKVKGWVSFTLPDGAIPAYIKYQTDFLNGNYLLTGVTQ